MTRKMAEHLGTWAEARGVDKRSLPKVSGNHPVYGKSEFMALYVALEHGIFLNTKAFQKVKASLENFAAHEGEHSRLAVLRTRLNHHWNTRFPGQNRYQKYCRKLILDEILRGEQGVIISRIESDPHGGIRCQTDRRIYLPSLKSRQKFAKLVGWIIDNNYFRIDKPGKALAPEALPEVEKACDQKAMPDYYRLFLTGKEKPEKAKEKLTFAAQELGRYLGGQLLRYHVLLKGSLIPEQQLDPAVLEKPLTSAEMKEALKSIKGTKHATDAAWMLRNQSYYRYNPNYSQLIYTAGSFEEYQAHKAGLGFQLEQANQKIAVLKKKKDRKGLEKLIQQQKKLQNSLKLLEHARSYAQAVRQVNALPKNERLEGKRMRMRFKIRRLEDELARQLVTMHQPNGTNLKTRVKAENSVDKLTPRYRKLLKKYVQLCDPAELYQRSKKRDRLLAGAKADAKAIRRLVPKSEAVFPLPIFAFSSVQAYLDRVRAVKHEEKCKSGKNSSADEKKEKSLAIQVEDELHKRMKGIYTAKQMLSYKSGF